MRIRGFAALLAAAVVSLTGCEEKGSPQGAPGGASAPAPPRRVSVLVTGREAGHLVEAGPRLLALWKSKERWPEAVALSTGDMYAGSAISSHFNGLPTAEVMKAMQYRAAAMGNHDMDLGMETFQAFRDAAGVTVLAANLKDRPDADQPLKLPPFTVIERGGVKLGVVGLTSRKTITTVVAGRASGLELLPVDSTLPPALDEARKAGAEVLIVVVDDCFHGLAKEFEAHPGWAADLVVGSRCDGDNEATVRETRFLSVGDDVKAYVSAQLELKGDGTRTLAARRVEVPATGPEDADMVAIREKWQTKLDQELGEVIAYSKSGVPLEAAVLRTWVATALKEETQSDIALVNRKGIRAELPKGDITRAHVYTMIPFENAVLTVKVKGAAVQKLKENPEAVLVGADKVDPAKEYQLATTEYLYFGGDGLGLEADAPEPELTGQVWQTPVISWLKKQGTGPKKPLEKVK